MICTRCGADDPLGSGHRWVFGREVGSVDGSTITYGHFEHIAAVACPRCVLAERERRRPTLWMVLAGGATILLAGALIVPLASDMSADLRNALMIGCGLSLLPMVIAAKWAFPGPDGVALEEAFRQAGAKGLTVFYDVADFERERNRGRPALRAPGVVPQKYLRLAAGTGQPPRASASGPANEPVVPCPNCAYPVPSDRAHCPSCGTDVQSS